MPASPTQDDHPEQSRHCGAWSQKNRYRLIGLRALWPRRNRLAAVLLLTLAPCWQTTLALPADPFPRPPALQPAMRFWMRIYSEFDISSGLIHDSRDLSICYTPLYLNRGAPLASQNRVIEETISHYRAAMLALADGKRADLNAFEQRSLEPWRRRGGTPEELRAAAERIRFQRGQEDRFRAGLKRAQPWVHQVEAIFRAQELPVGLAAIPHVESSYNPKAISKVGAAGLWQFMPTTARRYIRVDEEVDERYDVIKSTHAAANLLQHNYSVLEHWPLAITAYNHGLAGVRRAVRATGSDDIVRIIDEYQGNRFGFASRNFYVAFIAAHDLSVAPDRYFRQLDPDSALKIAAPAYLPAPELAEFLDISLHDLRAVNPGMHHDIWNGKQLIARNDLLRLPPPIQKPVAERKLAEFAARYGFDGQLPLTYYDLSYGESLSGIASRLDTSVSELVAMNDLDDAHQVQTGQRLRIPTPNVPRPLGTSAAFLLPELLSLQEPEQDTLTIAAAASRRAPSPEQPPEKTKQETKQDTPQIIADAADTGTDVEHFDADPTTAAPLAETQPDLAADPIDYSVSTDGSIEIQVAETLGHYAQWLKLEASQIRGKNALGKDKSLIIGQRLQLDFSHVSPEQFEQERIAFHRNRQLDYFAQYRITGVTEHLIRQGQSLWDIAVETYHIPLWLLRQYNPDIDTKTVLPLDQPLYVPIVETRLQPGTALTAAGS
ncbi:LysM peptidoglycan-binding domain-containing protein [Thiorhodovibrio frisius]|uniref:Soluble lytic murein transglycosylase-like protein n=1 Tax=Thiorhodovibrio frisius TaxID=631362 RepID=H8Z6B7_9GAMM|nr:transglycosylase SLT domain-containing protein [Thiorhodovibrio frisius]EIC20701.1 soluble lytic murein transglycosylase-like protein [Thiorhodovibrio frisius]WPL21449.1 Membrane-bound lytic murein transglycosylase D precursor [Thiorhodovibrio frisius]